MEKVFVESTSNCFTGVGWCGWLFGISGRQRSSEEKATENCLWGKGKGIIRILFVEP